MVKAIIIDDEKHCLETLGILLKESCPKVQLLEQCRSAKQGLVAIEKFQPDLVFLDIEMPVMNGFELLEQFINSDFVKAKFSPKAKQLFKAKATFEEKNGKVKKKMLVC